MQHFLQLKKLVRTARKAFAGRMLCRPASANDYHADVFSHSIKIRGLLKYVYADLREYGLVLILTS